LDAEYFRDGGVMTEGAELAQRLEEERALRLALQRRDDVVREARGLADRVLRRRRAGLPGAVGDQRAITERPDALEARHLEELGDDELALLLLARQRVDQRVRRRRHGADQRLRLDPLA